MKFTRFLNTECIEIGVKAENKATVLKAIAKTAKRSKIVEKLDEEEIFDGFMEREKLGSTAIGHRIAIPHYTSDKISDFVIGIITIPDGVDFESYDGEKTYLFFYIIAPQAKRNEHLGILSSVSRFLKSEENVDEILSCKTPSEIQKIISTHAQVKKSIEKTDSYNLLTIVVQIEDKFEDLINIFTETDGCSISVIEANNADKYLYSMPLFATLWKGERKDFNRIILGVVKRTQTNELLQKINSVIDELKNRPGIIVFVQDIFYSNGHLEL